MVEKLPVWWRYLFAKHLYGLLFASGEPLEDCKGYVIYILRHTNYHWSMETPLVCAYNQWAVFARYWSKRTGLYRTRKGKR